MLGLLTRRDEDKSGGGGGEEEERRMEEQRRTEEEEEGCRAATQTAGCLELLVSWQEVLSFQSL